MKQLDDFYSECLGFAIRNIKSGKLRVIASERRLINEEGYGIIFPFWMLHSADRYIISVRPDLFDLASTFIRNESDAKTLFDDGAEVIEIWLKSVLLKDDINKLRKSHSFELFVDREHFKPFNIPECRQLTTDDHALITEMDMDKGSNFGCSDECIRDGTAFGVIINGKIVSRSTTIITPSATNKYNLVWIGVETLPEYRKRGYAKAVVSGTTEILLSKGHVPVYSHADWNIASGNTARSLGYQFYGELLRWQY